MKRFWITMTIVCFVFVCGCGSSSSTSGVGGTDTGAASYANFGTVLDAQVPAGLKTGGSNVVLSVVKGLTGTCAADYTDCPYLTAAGGGDSMAGEILSRLWGIDYDDECTEALFDAGTCFTCVDCVSGSEGSDYIKPTVLDDPDSCATVSTTSARYVNFGVDPCMFDSMIARIENVDECAAVEGEAVDISSAVPFHASWGIPQTINFSAQQKSSDGDGSLLWTVNEGDAGTNQYFISLDSEWLYGGVKDNENERFLFFGTGSPAYYDGLGEGEGINIAAYAGSLVEDALSFEVIQVRDQDPNSYIERLRSNGTHVFMQSWSGDDFPTAPAEVDAVKDSPSEVRCVQIGESVVTSKYVSLDDCVESFGAASLAELNGDDNYVLKVIDGETAGAIDFTASLSSLDETSCAE